MPIAVKICGLTRPEDVEGALEAGADCIGVVFDRGPRKVDAALARELLAVTRGATVERIAVVGDLDVDARERIGELGFDAIQAVASDRLADAPGSLPLLPVFFDAPDLLERVHAWRLGWSAPRATSGSLIGTVNVDGQGGGGTGVRADWGRARGVGLAGPLTLSGGLRVDNLAVALASVPSHGVDVCSGVERAPGIKDLQMMKAFLREVRRLEEQSPEAA